MGFEYWVLSWWDASDDLIEWDIIADDAVSMDGRCGPLVADAVANPAAHPELGEDGIYIAYDGVSGPETHQNAALFRLFGPFGNVMSAQYFVDGKLMPEED